MPVLKASLSLCEAFLSVHFYVLSFIYIFFIYMFVRSFINSYACISCISRQRRLIYHLGLFPKTTLTVQVTYSMCISTLVITFRHIDLFPHLIKSKTASIPRNAQHPFF